MGRELQKMPHGDPVRADDAALVGLDGVKKMSKSAANCYIGVHDAPGEMFGKIMSITDDLMWNYYELLFRPLVEIEEFKAGIAAGTLNPPRREDLAGQGDHCPLSRRGGGPRRPTRTLPSASPRTRSRTRCRRSSWPWKGIGLAIANPLQRRRSGGHHFRGAAHDQAGRGEG